jgi:RES domain-containing protein
MDLFRLCSPKYADTAFTGEGSRLAGGRWTSKGLPAVYTASSLSLALLEMLVHLDKTVLPKLVAFRVSVPDDIERTVVSPKELPEGWNKVPSPRELRMFGDKWYRDGQSALLIVPSALISIESNIVINPSHADFRELEIAGAMDLDIDRRLLC